MKNDLPSAALGQALAVHVSELEVPAAEFSVQLHDWQVERGACVALIGANGSGKTTIMEALLGLRAARRLEGSLLGTAIGLWRRRPSLRRRLGVLLQNASLPAEFRVDDVVALQRELFGRTQMRVFEALGIELLRRKRCKDLSRGERQRVDLMLALAHEPELAFLDEPLTGLDRQFGQATCELLASMRDTTLVMACHNPEELALSHRVGWVRGGRLQRWDSAQALRHELLGSTRLQVSFRHEAAAEEFARQVRVTHAPRRVQTRQPLQVAVYGNDALGALARDLVEDARVDSVEFGRTSHVDLLYRCAQGDDDV